MYCLIKELGIDNSKNIALFRYYFMDCITFKIEDGKKCRHLQKEVF
jgi:hypothetical protein